MFDWFDVGALPSSGVWKTVLGSEELLFSIFEISLDCFSCYGDEKLFRFDLDAKMNGFCIILTELVLAVGM